MRGGKREGAGRPKAIIAAGYDDSFRDAQRAVFEVLPEMVGVMINCARSGDPDLAFQASKYLIDRGLGKPTEKKETGKPGDFSNLDGIPEDAARSVIEASERFTSGSRRASK